jgi:hypothetical protein
VGIAGGLTGLIAVALAVGPASPGQATAPSGESARSVVTGTPYQPLLRAHSSKPSVTRLTPQSGPSAGGTDVVIQGHHLSGAKRVLFGATKGTDLRVKNARKLVIQAPPHEAGLVPVRVVTKHGGSRQNKATHFTYVAPPPPPSPPSLTQLSPQRGPTAGRTTVTLAGSGLSGATELRFGGTDASSFHVTSATTITAISPARPAGPVNVTVTTAVGSATLDDAFSYVAAPTLYYVDPGQGPLVSTTVTLVGMALTADARVTFGGASASVLSASPDGTRLTVNTPAHPAGFVDVVVTTVGGSTTVVHGYLFIGGTTLTAVTPSAGPSSGGATVTLTGTGFTGETLVTFGNKPSLEVLPNLAGTQLTALLPVHPAGPVDVSVATAGGSATLAGGFTYVDAPTLTTVTPTTGPTGGGTSLTLTGTGFRAGMQVRLGGVPATGLTVVSATQATARTPAHAAGAVDVSVTTPGGTATLPGDYTYVAAPTLSAVSPNQGPASGGQTVTLTGTHFQAGMQVGFGATLGAVVTIDPSGTLATVTTPAHAAGGVKVTVVTPGGTASLAGGYTFAVAPTLTAVAPDVGPIGGGTSVTLTGTGFRAGMQVLFGGTPAALVSVNGPGTSARVTTPAHAAAVVDVSVTTPGDTATQAKAFTYLAAPTLTAVSPDEGPTAGGQSVTLTGTGFRAGMQVRLGGHPATLGSVNPDGTSATITTPSHVAAVVDVSVTTPGGSASLAGGYTYVVVPTLTAVTPDAGPTAGGTSVTLTGAGFRAGMQVRFGGTPAALVSVNGAGTSARVTTPAHAAALVDVSADTPGGTAHLSDAFTYLAAPTLTAVTPNEGPTAGGQSVTLTGTSFRTGMQVRLGGRLLMPGSVNPDGTSATITTPAHPAGVVDVSVTTPGGSASLAAGYTYLVAPTLTAVSPATGPAAGGATVTLTGTGFRAGMPVSFGGAAATGLTIISATQATVVTPAHAVGVVSVSVSPPGGTATRNNGYTYVVAPTLSAITPDNGPAAGGTTVTLTGTGLTGATSVTFDGVPGSGVTVVTDHKVTVQTPMHGLGVVNVEVTTAGGTAALNDAYTYVP